MISEWCAALETVDAELAITTDKEAVRQAQLLLEACQAAGALHWVFALALFLDNGPALAGVRHHSMACKRIFILGIGATVVCTCW